MRHLAIDSLSKVGIDFQFGHDIFPAPKISQVLWFRLASNTPQPPSDTYYWLEDESGRLTAFVLNNLEYQPEAIIPFLVGVTSDAWHEMSLEAHLQQNWLFPPSFHVTQVKDALINPSQAFLWKAIRQRLLTILAMPDVPAALLRQIETFLEASQKNISENNEGVVVERYALTPHHEVSPSIDRLDEISEFISMSQQFRELLSGDILGLFDFYAPLLNARTHTIENYNTACSWTTTQRRNRIQAINVFPWLFHELCLRTGGPDFFHEPAHITTHMKQDIAEAIDLGHPLIPLLAKQYNIQKHTLRYAKTLLKSRYRIPECIPPMLWLLDGIKPDKRPTRALDMKILNNVIDWIGHWQLEADRVYVEVVASTFFKDGIPGFRALIERYCPSHNPVDPFNELSDYLADYAERTIGTLIDQRVADALIKEWIKEAGLIALLVESERWHTGWWMRESDIQHLTWPSLMPDPQRIGSLVVCELSNTHMLFEEGRNMRHCIASYAPLCHAGKAYIFSLRNLEDGKRRSTLQVGINESGKFIINEHRAFANRDPDKECIVAACQFVDTLQVIPDRSLEEHLTA